MINDKNILDFEQRQKIYNYISKNPGIHKIEIARKLNIPYTTLSYHLKYLLKLDLIENKFDGKYKRFYSIENMGAEEKKIISLLRKKVTCKIILYLLFSISFSQIELSKELNLHPSTVSFHLQKMIDLDIIEKASIENGCVNPNINYYINRKPVGREIIYRRKNQKVINIIFKVLIKYKSNLPNKKIIDSYLHYLSEVDSIKVPKKIRSVDDQFNSLLDSVQTLFSPPFCA